MIRNSLIVWDLNRAVGMRCDGSCRARGVSVALVVFLAFASAAYGQDDAPETDAIVAPQPARNATVRAVLELPRETPADHFHAVVTLMDLAATDEARQLLSELATQDLTDAQRAELVREFGTFRMMQLVRDPALAETAGPFVEQCMAAAAASARDPERLKALLERLAADSPEERHAATVDLADAGSDGVRAALEALAREDDQRSRAALRQALVAMQPLSIGPTLAVLSTANPQLQADAIRVLTALRVARCVPLLAVPALHSPANSQAGSVAHQAYQVFTGEPISTDVAQQRLHREIMRYSKGMLPDTPDANGEIELWFWDDAGSQLSSERYPSNEASVIWAARLAEDLYQLNPADGSNRQLAILLAIEAAKLRQGYDLSLGELTHAAWLKEAVDLHSAEPFALSELLGAALSADCAGTAAAACEMLAQVGNEDVLYSFGGERSPLAEALRSRHRRVRFAAVDAIKTLDPQLPYAGSSRLPQLLDYFSSGGAARVALVAGPLLTKAATVAGFYETAGYSTEVAVTGNDLVRLARNSADAEFVVVDVRIGSPGIRDVIVTLRSHPESASLPIAVLAPAGSQPLAYRLAEEVDGVVAVAPPHNQSAAADLAARLVAMAGRGHVPLEERADEAQAAIDFMGELLAEGDTYYELRSQTDALPSTLYRPKLSEQAIDNLALVGTPASQLRLLEFASRPTVPIESRRAAAEAFDRSVKRHGVLLTTAEIEQQYDIYNASQSADAETQQLLGQLLDSLEARREAGR